MNRKRRSVLGMAGAVALTFLLLIGLANFQFLHVGRLTVAHAAYALKLQDGQEALMIKPMTVAADAALSGETSSELQVGRVTADSVLLDKPLIILNAASANVEANAASLFTLVLASLKKLSFKNLKIQDGTIAVQNGNGAIPVVEMFTAEFKMSRGRGTAAGRGSFVFRHQEIRFDISFGVTPTADEASNVPVRLELDSQNFRASFDGNVSTSGQPQSKGKLEIISESLRDLITWLDISVGDVAQLRSARMGGDLSLANGAISLGNALFRVDENEASGFVSVNFKNGRPSLDATLDLGDVNLTSLGLVAETDVTGAAKLSSVLQDGSIFQLADRFDADLRISARSVSPWELGQTAFTVSFRSGKLLADVAELQLHGGMATGQLEFDIKARPLKMSLRGELNNIEIQQSLTALVGYSPIQGSAMVVVNVEALGRYEGALAEGLTGTVQLNMPSGGQMELDLPGLIQKTNTKNLDGWPVSTRTRFDELKTRIILRDGKAFSETLQMRAQGHLYSADASVNFTAGQIYVRIDLNAPDPKAEGQNRSATNARSLIVRGPWRQPVIHLESLEMGEPQATQVKGVNKNNDP